MGDSFRNTPNDSSVYLRGSKVMKAIVALNISAADILSGGDVVPICQLPKEAIVTSIKVINETLDSGTDAEFDIGIWKQKIMSSGIENNPDGDGIQIVDDDQFEAIDQDIYVDATEELQTANLVLVELLANDQGASTQVVNAADIYKTVREIAGDEVGEEPAAYFLGLKATISTVSGAASGNIVFHVEWVQG